MNRTVKLHADSHHFLEAQKVYPFSGLNFPLDGLG